jgi:type I restriction enzyme M protein
MAALLLAMSTDSPINTSNDAFNLIQEINFKAETVLHKNGKREFHKYISIAPPPTPDNHIKFRRAILDTMQELNGINIKSAMNSGTDILGRFYEQFLKYGNGAKEIGIVLTPRHVTKASVEMLNTSYQDTVLDPASGTGGFLVAAYDFVRKNCTIEQLDNFKSKGIYGIEQDPEVVALALVNMIFRGDGKNNIIEGNCFTTNKFQSVKMTRVLMNPPFALKKDSEKEYKFVDIALSKMDTGGLMFVILPISIMFESGEVKEWRKEILLKNNTLLSVITLPPELFYPIGVHTLGVIIKKGIIHPQNQNVLWVRIMHDGFVKIKGKRLLSIKEPNDIIELLPTIQAFIHNPSFSVTSIPEKIKAAPIDFTDPLLELVPEAYLDAIPPSEKEIQDMAEQLVRETTSLAVKHPNLWQKGK